MRRSLTARVWTAIAAVAFVMANGLSSSGVHALAHESAEHAESVGSGAHAAHQGAAASHQAGHDRDGSDRCGCFGTCANVTPPGAPSTGTVPAAPSQISRVALAREPTPWIAPRPTAYLFPLPNAPPARG